MVFPANSCNQPFLSGFLGKGDTGGMGEHLRGFTITFLKKSQIMRIFVHYIHLKQESAGGFPCGLLLINLSPFQVFLREGGIQGGWVNIYVDLQITSPQKITDHANICALHHLKQESAGGFPCGLL